MNKLKQMRQFMKSYCFSELSIELKISNVDQEAIFTLCFHNESEESQILVFDNNHRQVEQSNIYICNKLGEKVDLHSRVYIRANPDFELHTLLPNSDLTYELKGTLNHGLLQFPGASFLLNEGEAYGVQYRYPFDKSNNYASNIVEWVV